MIPFMTGTGDSPPLYMLYGVVVHLDTLNASFSGHYVSYVKDLQGTWFRIDDTEVTYIPSHVCYVVLIATYYAFFLIHASINLLLLFKLKIIFFRYCLFIIRLDGLELSFKPFQLEGQCFCRH